MSVWSEATDKEKAEILDAIEYTFTCGDDYNIRISNATRAVINDDVEFERRLTAVFKAAIGACKT